MLRTRTWQDLSSRRDIPLGYGGVLFERCCQRRVLSHIRITFRNFRKTGNSTVRLCFDKSPTNSSNNFYQLLDTREPCFRDDLTQDEHSFHGCRSRSHNLPSVDHERVQMENSQTDRLRSLCARSSTIRFGALSEIEPMGPILMMLLPVWGEESKKAIA